MATSAITNPYLSQRFRTLIWRCLDADLLKTATFYAERFFSVDTHNHEARHLFATTLLKSGQTQSALHLVKLPKDTRCTGCAEIYAQCCTALGRARQAREALESCLKNVGSPVQASAREARTTPNDAVLHCRAGTAAALANMPEKAIASFNQTLILDPLLFEAFEGLCALGCFPEIDDVFRPGSRLGKQPSSQFDESKLSQPVASGLGFFTPDATQSAPPARTWKIEPGHSQPFRMDAHGRPSLASTNDSSFFEPSIQLINQQQGRRGVTPPIPVVLEEGAPATKRARGGQVQNTRAGPSKAPAATTGTGTGASTKKARQEPLSPGNPLIANRHIQPPSRTTGNVEPNPARRSTRLMTGGKSTQLKHPPQRDRRRPARTRSQSAQSVGSDMDELGEVPYSPSPSSIAQSPRSEPSPAPSNAWVASRESEEYEAADNYIFDLMIIFARAVRALAMYDCETALAELSRLPMEQQWSPTVMTMVGRAHYFRSDYIQAERAFIRARTLDPYRLADMEVYSTLLWHLRRNYQLSFLAQELVAIDPRSAIAWIAVGNCFSLQKEHPQSLTCFRRAIQLDPNCAYAYTLSGHECLVSDDMEKAIGFFQMAIKVDPRHYNAWYGLGSAYMKMGKMRVSEYHLRKAVEIHPNNPVLLASLGKALERCGLKDEAMMLYDEGVQLEPPTAMVYYRRAKLLLNRGQYKDAEQVLLFLRDLEPTEANIPLLLGKVYHLTGNKGQAAQQLAIARDIDPKVAGRIRKMIEGKGKESSWMAVAGAETSTEEMDEG